MTQSETVKAALRRDMRARRAAFVAELQASGRLAGHLRAITARIVALFDGARVISAYAPLPFEPDPLPALALAAAAGLDTALPSTTADGGMRFMRWTAGNALIAGRHGLREPSPDAEELYPDIVLTPLVAFDDRLVRLGQGGGYYDRYFARHPSARRIGIGWSVQKAEYPLPAERWDLPLHIIITESALFEGVSA